MSVRLRPWPLICAVPWIFLVAIPVPSRAQQPDTVGLAEPTRSTGFRFTGVIGVVPLADSALFVADAIEEGLVRFHWERRTDERIGRRGEGPGELQSVGPIWPIVGDSLFLADAYARSWNVVIGDSIIPVNRPGVGSVSVSALRGLSRVGGVLTNRSGFGESARSLVLHRLEGGRPTVVTKLLSRESGMRARVRLPSGAMGLIGGNPLDSFEDGVLFPDGSIAVVRLDPYRVDWRSPGGEWTEGRPLPFEPVRVDRGIRCFAIERYIGLGCRSIDLEGWPDTVPPFVPANRSPGQPVPSVLAASGGRVAVVRTPSPDLERRVDIVDRTGRLERVLFIPPDEHLLGFGPGSIYILSENELGLQEIREHAWPPAG